MNLSRVLLERFEIRLVTDFEFDSLALAKMLVDLVAIGDRGICLGATVSLISDCLVSHLFELANGFRSNFSELFERRATGVMFFAK